MRELIISKIKHLRDNGSATHMIFIKPDKKRTEEKILKDNLYTWDFDFNSLNDEDLVNAFEKVCRWAYKPWA